jgi:hypothetical protein
LKSIHFFVPFNLTSICNRQRKLGYRTYCAAFFSQIGTELTPFDNLTTLCAGGQPVLWASRGHHGQLNERSKQLHSAGNINCSIPQVTAATARSMDHNIKPGHSNSEPSSLENKTEGHNFFKTVLSGFLGDLSLSAPYLF